MDTAGEAIGLLGAGRAFEAGANDERELRRLVERGIPRESADLLIESLPAKQRPAWRGLLSPESEARLPLASSERAARLAYVLALAIDVWGGKAPAHRFLAKPHPLRDGKAPLEAAQTEWGGRAVEELLRKIQFGLPV